MDEDVLRVTLGKALSEAQAIPLPKEAQSWDCLLTALAMVGTEVLPQRLIPRLFL